MKNILKVNCFAFVMFVVVAGTSASAQTVPRYYTNDMSCAAIKNAIESNKKVLLRFTRPGGSRILYDLFYSSPLSCGSDEEAVSQSVPSAGGACRVSYRCVRRMDDDDDDCGVHSNLCPGNSVVPVEPPKPDPDPVDDGCNGCEAQ